MSPTLIALTGFVSWSLFLLVLMEVIRSKLVLVGAVPANGFDPNNSSLSPFMQRLARAHANCVEGLPIFGGLMLIAVAAGRTPVRSPTARACVGSGATRRRLIVSLLRCARAGWPAAPAQHHVRPGSNAFES